MDGSEKHKDFRHVRSQNPPNLPIPLPYGEYSLLCRPDGSVSIYTPTPRLRGLGGFRSYIIIVFQCVKSNPRQFTGGVQAGLNPLSLSPVPIKAADTVAARIKL